MLNIQWNLLWLMMAVFLFSKKENIIFDAHLSFPSKQNIKNKKKWRIEIPIWDVLHKFMQKYSTKYISHNTMIVKDRLCKC